MFKEPCIAGLLIAVLLLAACSSPATSPVATATPLPPTATPVARSPAPQGKRVPTNAAEVPRITPQALKSLLEGARYVVVIDTRSRDEYEKSHIPGAIQMLPSEIATRYGELPRGPKIVFYCA